MQQSQCDYTHATVVGRAWHHSHTYTEIEDERTVPVATPRLTNYRLDFKTKLVHEKR